MIESSNYDPNWVNIEDNDDLNSSNESYISSSSGDDDEEFDSRNTFGSQEPPKQKLLYKEFKDLNREERALVSRRFQPYFNKMNINVDEYWRRGRRTYDSRQWLKITFDGEMKRIHEAPR